VNLRLHEAELLDASRRVSKRFLQRVVTADHADPDHKRMHPHDAIAAKAVARQRIRIASMFERVEQDALHLPFRIKTPYGESTNVYLVHAIDCASSVPLGWCLVIGAPRVTDTLRCVESILFPKAPRLDQLGLKYDFDIYGTPALLVLDNGPENKSDRLVSLSRLGISVNRLKARHAHRKPFIERLNRSLKEALETLPGSTRLNGVDGKRDPVALGDQIMTLEEMERWIVRFYFDEWINRPLERLRSAVFTDNEDLGRTPLRRYQMVTQERGYPIPLPPSVDTWRSAIYEPHIRTLSRKTGISYENYQFRGDQLAHLIHVYGETSVKVLVDPDDFRWVYVVDRDGTTLVPLVNDSTSEITPAYSFDEARAVLEEADDEGVNVAQKEFRRDVLNRSAGRPGRADKKAKGAKATSKAAQSRQTVELARRHGAVKRSADKPVPPPAPSLGNPPITVREEDWCNATALAVFDRLTGEKRK
jgi:putative transposase